MRASPRPRHWTPTPGWRLGERSEADHGRADQLRAPGAPVECLGHAGEAAQAQEHQEGLRLLVDVRGAKVVHPALQNVGALFRTEPDLRKAPR